MALVALAAMWLLMAGGVRAGTVSLEWRPAVQRVSVGDTVAIGLYAVSDTSENQSLSGIEALALWNPDVLSLSGLTNDGPFSWLASWFPTDGQLDGLNDTWLDGDAFYQAFGPLAPTPSAQATGDGLLVTTLRYDATGAGTTALLFMPTFGKFSFTRVFDATVPGAFLTGTLRGATVIVAGCGVVTDVDLDCDVDLVDFASYDACLSGPGEAPSPGCLVRDVDTDGVVTLRDFARVQRSFTGSIAP